MSAKNLISRRRLLTTGALAAAAPVLAIGGVFAVAETSGASVPGKKVTILTMSDPSFAAELDRHFPGLKDDDKFAALSSLSVLIRHHEGPPVRAFSLNWTVTTPTDSFETAFFHYAKPGTKRTGRKKLLVRTVASAQKDILPASGVRLVTPYFRLSPKAYKQSPTGWHSQLKAAKMTPLFLTAEAASATQVTVGLDAVVYKDRTVVGPDKFHLKKRLHCRRNAEHDEARSLLKMLRDGGSDQELVQALQERGMSARSYATGPEGWYHQARRHHAQVLLNKFVAHGRARFTRELRRLTNLKRTRLKKIG